MTAKPATAGAVIVTGAGRGLGRAYAHAIARRGTPVLVNDAHAELAARTAADIEREGGLAGVDTTPVGDATAAGTIVANALDAFGAISGLVHNAGITRDRTIANLTDDDIEDVLTVHLRGALYLTRAVWPHFKAQQYGRVVLVSSASGSFGNVGQAAYAAAKAGVVGLTKTLAFEGERRGILVNAVAPLAQTDMAGDLFGADFQQLRPEHVAPLVDLLTSPECPVTGQLFTAGGGRIATQAVAETRGVWFDDDSLTADGIRAKLNDALELDRCLFPRTLHDDITLHTPRLASTEALS